jgi:hypothetical protein
VCVCPSVSSYSRTAGFEAAHEQYQRLQNYANLKNRCTSVLFIDAVVSSVA